jgi:hypothetical protein
MPKFLAHKIHDLTEKEVKGGAFILGASTFFLPCGFTQALQLYVLAKGSFTTGALTMLAFALGTSGLTLAGAGAGTSASILGDTQQPSQATLQRDARLKHMKIILYDLPPAEFFYIADDTTLLATWYPFGEAGESSPCIFVRDINDPNAKRLLRHYKSSFEFLQKEFGGRLASTS